MAWAYEHFWGAPVGDLRRMRRVVEVAGALRARPEGSLPQALPAPADLKGAYRVLNHADVTHGAVLSPHTARTRAACHVPGDYLLIEDTTALSFSHRSAVAGLGPLTHPGSQGLLVHTCLATRLDGWDEALDPQLTPVGLLAQEAWARGVPEGTRAQRKAAQPARAARGEACESDRWGRALTLEAPLPEGVRWTLVADREADIFALWEAGQTRGVDWVIRATQPRTTLPDHLHILEAVAQGPVLGCYGLPLRARPGVAARTALLEVRAVSKVIEPPRRDYARHFALPMGLVEVREVDPPDDVTEPIHWLLVTSWPCATFDQARRVVGAYASRWLIEEYHKALKTGTGIEASQLATAGGLLALLALHAVVAMDLLRLQQQARTQPDAPVPPALITPDAQAVLEAFHPQPPDGWTCATLLSAIAQLGGYQARTGDGPPGWLTLWRGWKRLNDMTLGYAIGLQHKTSG